MTDSIIASSETNTQTINTSCCYCGVGCGVQATVENNQIVDVKGQENHPANLGRLCVKGSSLHETQTFSDRLTTPLLNGIPSTWDDAMNFAASKFKNIYETYGPNSVAFYLSGQLLTEDYYIANKLMKGFVGTANIDTNSRLCMASAVVAHKRAFGEDIVPGCYEDLEQTDLLLLVGSNMAYTHPVVYQRIVAAKQARSHMQIVVLDPRRTPTCDIADTHLAIRPGADAFFFNGLLVYLAEHNGLDQAFVEGHTQGVAEALSSARAQADSVQQVAKLCDVDAKVLEGIYAAFLNNEKVVSVFSQGINQSSSGVDKGNAIINCHLASGKIGKPGAAPFSITGQPNAMGGREVGGLANQLAAHMDFSNEESIDRVRRFWDAPNMATKEGCKAVDMFDAIHRGEIKAVWIMATNPVVSMPEANKVRDALRRCELVIVSDCVKNTDTAQEADVVFPSTTWGEKTGTVTNSERCITVQNGILTPPQGARNDWQIVAQFAEYLGFNEHFNYASVADIFREHAALSGFENNGSRAFDIGALKNISDQQFFELSPFTWPLNSEGKSTKRLFSDGHFYTGNGKARFVPITARFPFRATKPGQVVLNTGRVRDQWHTMGRTGSLAKLVSHINEPFVELHPEDAKTYGISNNDLVRLFRSDSDFIGRARITAGMRKGEVFAPIHWNDRYASHARISALVTSVVDPHCGQPEFKHTPVNIERFECQWQATLFTTQNISPTTDYWCKIALNEGYKYRLAGRNSLDYASWLQSIFPTITDWVELTDSNQKNYRAAGFVEHQLGVQLTVAPTEQGLPEAPWVEQHIGQVCSGSERLVALAGTPGGAVEDQGPMVCSCFQVGENAIRKAIENGCRDAAQLGVALKCGTNCGSCLPEINAVLARELSHKQSA